MPWKLFLFIIALAVACVFMAANVHNVCTVSFIFKIYDQVPVYLVVFIAFAVGVFVMLPFTIGKRITRQRKPKEDKKESSPAPIVPEEKKPIVLREEADVPPVKQD